MEHEDCDDCVRACHLIHNVPEFDSSKDEIKWIWKETFHHAFHEMEHEHLEEKLRHAPVMVLCNHCDNPPCVRVCPTQATWKREKDGIVMMDWHRCIGCRYCVAACPYGSRSFNWRDPRPFIDDIQPDFPTRVRGVVEKCTFCEERLVKGQMPACVEACRHGALTFGDLEDSESDVRRLLHDNYTIRRKPALGTRPEVYYIV
jgi:molybdopterin-containing oxidoreductase family iron-sulfur binding subunit